MTDQLTRHPSGTEPVRIESPGIRSVQPRYAVIVPVFNEEHAIAQTLDAIRTTLAGGEHYEVIVVDDGSTDGTAEALRAYDERNPGSIRVIGHRANRGYGAALKTGIRSAAADLIVITDADGTYPIDRIPELVATIAARNVAMVVGARTGDDVTYSRIRRIPKVFLKAYIEWLARSEVPDFNSGLRVFRRELAERFFGILPNGFSFTTTITLACMTNRLPVVFVPINYAMRVGSSKIQPVRDTARFFQLIVRTGMYFAPLRVIGPIAVVLFLAALASLGYDVYNRNLTDSTVLLFVTSLHMGVFALLADMIDKRVPK